MTGRSGAAHLTPSAAGTAHPNEPVFLSVIVAARLSLPPVHHVPLQTSQALRQVLLQKGEAGEVGC